MSVIVIEFTTLDGVVSDPDGSAGTPLGGWAFREDRETAGRDAFRLGRTLDEGVLLLGRATWELFARLFPGRDDPFAARMNAAPKLVASRTLSDASAWANSRLLDGAPADGGLPGAVRRERRDVVVAGSLSVAHQLMAADLVDEYRLLTFPTVLGTGDRLFPDGCPHTRLKCVDVEPRGAAVFTRYRRAAR